MISARSSPSSPKNPCLTPTNAATTIRLARLNCLHRRWSQGLRLYVIEMRQGCFATKEIVAGERAVGLASANTQ